MRAGSELKMVGLVPGLELMLELVLLELVLLELELLELVEEIPIPLLCCLFCLWLPCSGTADAVL